MRERGGGEAERAGDTERGCVCAGGWGGGGLKGSETQREGVCVCVCV